MLNKRLSNWEILSKNPPHFVYVLFLVEPDWQYCKSSHLSEGTSVILLFPDFKFDQYSSRLFAPGYRPLNPIIARSILVVFIWKTPSLFERVQVSFSCFALSSMSCGLLEMRCPIELDSSVISRAFGKTFTFSCSNLYLYQKRRRRTDWRRHILLSPNQAHLVSN